MKYILAVLFAAALLLAGCGGGDNGKGGGAPTQSQLEATPQGDRYYGGVFKMNEVEYFRSLYPLNVTEVGGHRITNQVYEGLVALDQNDLSIIPAIAESWEVNDAGTEYIFKIRKGVFYHDDEAFADGKGREVTANDFEYNLTRICESDPNNQGYWIFKDRVVGCTEYYESTVSGEPLPEGVAGIEVLDDYTLKIKLERPFASFLHVLAMPFCFTYPQEAYDKYGVEMRIKAVGTGPFRIKTLVENDAVFLERNPNYWGKDEFGNQLPYLDAIKWSFIQERKSEILEFKKGNLDMVFRLPLEMVDEVVDREDNLQPGYEQYKLQVEPSLALQYLAFQHKSELFDDVNLRKAFNYAVDRQTIVDYTVKGCGIAAQHGVVPPGLPGFDTYGIEGYKYDPAKAREFMKQAGYPNGEGFPEITLQINSGGGTNARMAEAIQKMLSDNLNITVNITQVPFAQHLEMVETGKTDFWRAGWIADYPNPENFLNLFYSKHIPESMTQRSYLNSTRYANPAYDEVFEKALQTQDDGERAKLYMEADQIMINDAAIIPVYYYRDHRLLQPYVRNFPQNAMEYRNLREVYFVPQQQESGT